jgi:hypothetical protein
VLLPEKAPISTTPCACPNLQCPEHLQISIIRISNEILAGTHQRIKIHGLGGCGKPEIAIKFAYHALAQHAGHLVLSALMSRESFELAYWEIGLRLWGQRITDNNADIKQLILGCS